MVSPEASVVTTTCVRSDVAWAVPTSVSPSTRRLSCTPVKPSLHLTRTESPPISSHQARDLALCAITRVFPEKGFALFRVGFAVLGLARLAVVPLAVANRGTLDLPAIVQWGVSGVFALLSGYLFYSVARYFSFARAMGADHFDPAAREWPHVREGIFRYTANAMYNFGFLALWIPGLGMESAAALLAAAFHHAYIWVHFRCTEKPDMERIYGG